VLIDYNNIIIIVVVGAKRRAKHRVLDNDDTNFSETHTCAAAHSSKEGKHSHLVKLSLAG